MSNLRFWLAASTHEGESLLSKNSPFIKEKFPDIITIIAPRHIDRVERIKKLCIKYVKCTNIKKNESISKNKEIIIINSFGTLNNY